MRPDRPAGSEHPPGNGPARPRFAETFARRPGLPRISRFPDLRAWSTTAVVVALVTGIAFAVPLVGRLGPNRGDAAYAADHPASLSAAPGSGIKPADTASPTAGRATTLQKPPTGALPPLTVTRPPSGVTQMLPPVPPPGPIRTTGTTTTVHGTTSTRPPRLAQPPSVTTTTAAPPRPRSTATTTKATQPAPKVVPVSVQNFAANRCIDVKDSQGGVGHDGAPLQVWDCSGSANQKWAFYPDGTVRSLGFCMDLALASTADGTQIQIARCNGGWAQKWTLNTAHDLVNPTANKCVNADSTGNGGRLVFRSCNGTANQKWRKA